METIEETPKEEEEREYREHPLMTRITCEPGFRGGKPWMKKAGMSVTQMLHMLANGWSKADIIRDYPHVAEDDVNAALLYAAWKMSHPG